MLFILNLLTLVLLQICLVSNLLLRVEVTQVQSLTPISFIIHTVIIILIYIVLVSVQLMFSMHLWVHGNHQGPHHGTPVLHKQLHLRRHKDG